MKKFKKVGVERHKKSLQVVNVHSLQTFFAPKVKKNLRSFRDTLEECLLRLGNVNRVYIIVKLFLAVDHG